MGFRAPADRSVILTPRHAVRVPAVAGIVLAAGLSRRMGGTNKLLLEIAGTSLVRRVTETALAAGLDPVVVVVGHEQEKVRRALHGLGVAFAENGEPEMGLSSSLRIGLEQLERSAVGIDGVCILLADMPWIEPVDISALCSAFDESRGIIVPVHGGRRGNPVLWSTRFLSEMKELSGDSGARGLLERHAASVHEVEVAGDGILRDIDTPEALPKDRSVNA